MIVLGSCFWSGAVLLCFMVWGCVELLFLVWGCIWLLFLVCTLFRTCIYTVCTHILKHARMHISANTESPRSSEHTRSLGVASLQHLVTHGIFSGLLCVCVCMCLCVRVLVIVLDANDSLFSCAFLTTFFVSTAYTCGVGGSVGIASM